MKKKIIKTIKELKQRGCSCQMPEVVKMLGKQPVEWTHNRNCKLYEKI